MSSHKAEAENPANIPFRNAEEEVATLAHAEDEDERIIRCICRDTNPDDPRQTIQCDRCGIRQHRTCMGAENDAFNEYYCQLCEPENRAELLAASRRGDVSEIGDKLAEKRRMSRKAEGRQELKAEMNAEEEKALKAREVEREKAAHERGKKKRGIARKV